MPNACVPLIPSLANCGEYSFSVSRKSPDLSTPDCMPAVMMSNASVLFAARPFLISAPAALVLSETSTSNVDAKASAALVICWRSASEVSATEPRLSDTPLIAALTSSMLPPQLARYTSPETRPAFSASACVTPSWPRSLSLATSMFMLSAKPLASSPAAPAPAAAMPAPRPLPILAPSPDASFSALVVSAVTST